MMKSFNVTLVSVLALAAANTAARADSLSDLKAEIDSLDARLAAMEAAPAVPQGYQLLTISEGALQETPGAPLTARERAAFGGRATIISIVPSADAPAATTISWSGYTRAGVIYNRVDDNTNDKAYIRNGDQWLRDPKNDTDPSKKVNDWDVGARGQLLVQATTDSSVGEVGVQLKLRADYNGNGPGDVYGKVAWGYWSMTPELTLGGGYNQSIGDIVYGYDGSCTCYFTDNADVDFNPGDTTQMRLSYGSGPVTLAVAVEGGALDNATINDGLLGIAGEAAYSGDVFSGEIAGVWRDSNKSETGSSDIWQVGLGGSAKLGDLGSISFAAATGEGPYEINSQGTIVNGLAYDNRWWGASVFTSINLSSSTHAELAGGYKHRDGDQATYKGYDVSGVDYDTYAAMGGIYYTPVSQLTLGVEGEWYTTATSATAAKDDERHDIEVDTDTLWVDAVAVWSF